MCLFCCFLQLSGSRFPGKLRQQANVVICFLGFHEPYGNRFGFQQIRTIPISYDLRIGVAMRARLRQTGKLRLSYGRAPCAALLSRRLRLPRLPRAPFAAPLPRRPRLPRLPRAAPLPRSPRASCRRALNNPSGLARRGAACVCARGRVDNNLIND